MNLGGRVASSFALVTAAVATAVFMTRRPPPPPPPQLRPAVVPSRPKVQIVPGHIEAQRTIPVDIATPGILDGFFADVGQSVSEGQVIARLAAPDSPDAGSALVSAQAKVDRLKTAIEEARLEAAKAKADSRRAQDQAAQARKIFEHEQKLSEFGATPKQTLEQTRQESEDARLNAEKADELWREADNRTYTLVDQLREAADELENAGKQEAALRASVAAAEIHAPASGLVVSRNGRIGQKTGPQEGKEVFRLAVDLTRLRAVFPLDTLGPAPIATGQEVLITISGLEIAPIRTAISTVDGTNASADFISPNTAILPGAQCSVSVQLK